MVFPNELALMLDQERLFDVEYFQSSAEVQGIELQFSLIESHNYIEKGDTYHHQLRRIFIKLKIWPPLIYIEVILRLNINALNHTEGPSGLSPSMLL